MDRTYVSSRVLTTDHADIVLTGHGTSTLLIGGNVGNERVVALVAVPVAATFIALHISADRDLSPLLAGPIIVDHACRRQQGSVLL